MLVTLLGMVMEVKLRQKRKAASPIHLVPSLMEYVDKVLSTAPTKGRSHKPQRFRLEHRVCMCFYLLLHYLLKAEW